MRNTVRKFIKTAGKIVGLNKLFWYIQGLLQEPEKAFQNNNTDTVFGEFNDSHGNQVELFSGLRDRLKPGWQSMLNPSPLDVPPVRSLTLKVEEWKNRVISVDKFLGTFSSSLVGKDILEIGTFDGATAYALASHGAKNVLAIDMAAYYITETPGGMVSEDAIAAKNKDLTRLRGAYAQVLDEQVALRVSFQEDDICVSSVPSQSMDIVVSWEVLEHLTRPQEAFREMARILKPGGFAFHEYNPFFSLDGGHSLCTLDFPWGHARLDDRDFERYLEKIRPNEKDVALSFYRNNLHKMTLVQLMHYMKEAGLSPLSVLPWCSRDHLGLVTSEILAQCQVVYPGVRLVDLITPFVWVLAKKENSSAELYAPSDIT